MKKVFIKVVTLVLVFVMVAMLAIGCGSKPKESAQTVPSTQTTPSTTGQATPSPTQQDAPGKLPIVKDPITLTYWVDMDTKMSATLKSYGDMLFYQELQKKTNIKIDFKHPPAGQGKEQFNLMLASQDLPDMVEYGWSTIPGGPEKAIQDGVIIDLTELTNKNAPDYMAVLNKNPQARKDVMTDSGKFYMFPNLYIDEAMRIMSGSQIRKDWLDKLGLSVPATMDDWYKALKEIKTKDPNGNGKPDEIPFIAIKLAGEEGLTNFVHAWGLSYDFLVDNGKVKYGPGEPAYKEFLTTMNKWYKEGLIDPDFASSDAKSYDAKLMGDQAGGWFAGLMGDMGRFLQLMEKKDPKFNIAATPRPKSNMVDKAYDFFTSNSAVSGNGTAITTKNKYKAESVRWLNYQYSDEGHYLYNFGVEGKTYKMENGYPKFTELITKSPEGWALDQAIGHYARGNSGTGPHVADPRAYEQRASRPQQIEAKKIWGQASKERNLPRITPTGDESQKIAAIMTEVNTYRDEMTLKFIMGQEPLENFDKYISSIKKMGLDEAIKLQQAAVDRYKARK